MNNYTSEQLLEIVSLANTLKEQVNELSSASMLDRIIHESGSSQIEAGYTLPEGFEEVRVIMSPEYSTSFYIPREAIRHLDKLKAPAPLEQEPKKIDLSVLVSSDIDCEFSYADGDWGCLYGKLAAIADGYFHLNNKTRNTYTGCRPRFNHTHASPIGWDKCPIPDGFIIKWWNPLGEGWEVVDTNYIDWNWRIIVMFQITGIVDGREL